MTLPESAAKLPKSTRLDSVVANLVQIHGAGTIRQGSAVEFKPHNSIPTGSISLDIAIGVGGIPRGRVTQIYGPEGCGKTTLALSILAEAQRLDGQAVFIDMDRGLYLPYAARLGVKLDELLLVSPDTGEQAFDIMEALIRSGEVDVVVLDSIAALVPAAEYHSDMETPSLDQSARLIDKAMRKLSGLIAKTNSCVIFTDQLRLKAGIMFGNPEGTTGGMPVSNWASLRLDVRRIHSIKSGAQVIGTRTRVKVVKNRLAPPYRTAEFDIRFNQGISKLADLLDIGVMHAVVEKRGAFYAYGDTRMGQGRQNAIEFLRGNEAIATEIEHKLRGIACADVINP